MLNATTSSESSILFIFPVLCFLSLGFALAVSWMFRSVNAALAQDLTLFDKAYLIGGPVRALEMAVFQLIRDGWIYSDGKGYLYPRFQSAEGLSPLEDEVLQRAVAAQHLDGRQLARVSVSQLAKIESRLLKRGLILTEREFSLCRLLARIPIALVFIYGLHWIYVHGSKHPNSIWLMVAMAVSFFFFIHSERGAGRLTYLGDRVVAELSGERELRLKQKRDQQATSDERPEYDRLWEVKEEVLFTGFLKMHGTAFSSSASRMDSDQPMQTGEPQSQHMMAENADADLDPKYSTDSD